MKSEVATFFRAFPDGTVWGKTYSGEGYDLVLAAKNGGIRVDVDRCAERLQSADHMRAAMSLSQAGFPCALDLSRLGVSGKPGAVRSRRLPYTGFQRA